MYLPIIAALLPLAAALDITSISTSGAACPGNNEVSVIANEDPSRISLSIPGFHTTLTPTEVQNSTGACSIHFNIGGGEVGKRLVLESLDVWGGLKLSEEASGSIITTAFWSENAADTHVTRKRISTNEAFDKYVYVSSDIGLGSFCTVDEGSAGNLNINVRVTAEEGEISFGPHENEERTVPVSEHLGIRWEECEEE